MSNQTVDSQYWVPPKLWKGSTVFIIGGGSSLKGFDFTPIKGKRVIGCNDAYQLGNWVSVCYFGDRSWFDIHQNGRVMYPEGERVGLSGFTSMIISCCAIKVEAKWLYSVERDSLRHVNKNGRVGWYGSTGASAICLAVAMGAKRIVLLGYDMKLSKEGQNNWHANLVNEPNADVFPRFQKQFEKLAFDLKRDYPQVEVLNAGPDSDLSVFRKVTLQEVLQQSSAVSVSKLKEYWSNEGRKHITPPEDEFPEGFDVKEAVSSFLSDVDCKSIVDYGCGDGRLSSVFDFSKYYGIDYSADNVARASAKNPEYRFKEVDGNSDFPIADLFFAYTVLLHNPDDVVRDIIKKARAVGCDKFMVCEILGNEWRRDGTPPVFNRTQEQYEKLFAEFGFELKKIEQRPYKHYADNKRYDGMNTNIVYMLFVRMVKISILTPSHGRPSLVRRMIESVKQTVSNQDERSIEMLFYVDDDDPRLNDYNNVMSSYSPSFARMIIAPRKRCGAMWNDLARLCHGDLLFLGNDDLVFKTKDWDKDFVRWGDAFPDKIYLLYTNDGINANKHAAFPCISRRWYDTLGHFVPERFEFLYHDTWLWDLSKLIHRKAYVQNVLIHHLHFTQNKALMDETYDMNRRDGQAARDKLLYYSEECDKERKKEAMSLMTKFRTSLSFVKEDYSVCRPVALREILYGKKVALIGPGTGPTGKGRGQMFDSFDVVCRVNECFPFSEECKKDYGTRTDVVFHTLSISTLGNFMNSVNRDPERAKNIKAIVCPQLSKNDTEDKVQNYQSLNLFIEHPPMFTVCDNFWWTVVRANNGATPNTGTLAAMFLLLFKIDSLYIDGFDFYKKGTLPKESHYIDYLKWGGDTVKSNRVRPHDQLAQIFFFKTRLLIDSRVSLSKETQAVLDSYEIAQFGGKEDEKDGEEGTLYTQILRSKDRNQGGKR